MEEVIINIYEEREYLEVEKTEFNEDYKVKDINDIRKWAIKCNISQNNL